MTRKGQVNQGTVGALMIGLILVAGASVLMLNYIGGVGINYGVSVNDSKYSVFSQSQEITNLTSQMNNQFVNEEGEQNEDTDIISIMITNAYGTIKLFFNLPGLYSNLIAAALNSMGVPPGVSSVLSWMALSIITVLILFAAYEAVMKVRS
jgi:hypothetical protein